MRWPSVQPFATSCSKAPGRFLVFPRSQVALPRSSFPSCNALVCAFHCVPSASFLFVERRTLSVERSLLLVIRHSSFTASFSRQSLLCASAPSVVTFPPVPKSKIANRKSPHLNLPTSCHPAARLLFLSMAHDAFAHVRRLREPVVSCWRELALLEGRPRPALLLCVNC